MGQSFTACFNTSTRFCLFSTKFNNFLAVLKWGKNLVQCVLYLAVRREEKFGDLNFPIIGMAKLSH